MNILKNKINLPISTIAWITAILSGISAYFVAIEILKYLLFIDFNMFDSVDPTILTEQLKKELIKAHKFTIYIYFAALVASALMLISSIGIINKKDFGQKLYILSSWITILIIIGGIVGITIYIKKLPAEFQLSQSLIQIPYNNIVIVHKISFISGGVFFLLLARTLYKLIDRMKNITNIEDN